jgi:hypothetical protein
MGWDGRAWALVSREECAAAVARRWHCLLLLQDDSSTSQACQCSKYTWTLFTAPYGLAMHAPHFLTMQLTMQSQSEQLNPCLYPPPLLSPHFHMMQLTRQSSPCLQAPPHPTHPLTSCLLPVAP